MQLLLADAKTLAAVSRPWRLYVDNRHRSGSMIGRPTAVPVERVAYRFVRFPSIQP